MNPDQVRIAIADDQPVIAEGLSYVLKRYGFQVVGITHSGRGAIDLVQREQPDILVLDIMMPDQDGFEVAEALARGSQGTAIVILTARKRLQDAVRARELGLAGYLLKDMEPKRLCDILMKVAEGHDMIDRRLVDSMLAWDEPSEFQGPPGLIEPLTGQQIRVLSLIGAGMSNEEIATLLRVSENTIKTHVRHIYQKLMVSDRANAVIWAHQQGLVPVDLFETP